MNSSNFTCTSEVGKSECQVEFRSHDACIEILLFDYFGNNISPTSYNFSLNCSSSFYDSHVDSNGVLRIIFNDSIVKCPLDQGNNINIALNATNDDDVHRKTNVMNVVAYWNKDLGDCDDDIAHVASGGHGCLPLSCDLLHYIQEVPDGLDCFFYQYDPNAYSITSGYWIDNGFKQYVRSCSPGLCNRYADINYAIEVENLFPDRNYQCNPYWTGLACGECNSSKYSIIYGTTDCVHLKHCHFHSFVANFFVLLCVSLLYWCLVISFIFVLLHFQFDVTAGYAYSVIFYYSVLETFTNMIFALGHSADCEIYNKIMQALSFFSNIGNLKPPFLRYLGLCLHQTEVIDHVYLTYLHSLIVTTIIALLFVTARRFVTVARFIGRFVNSKSICLLLLLAYSSVCYTSVQLLKPLAVHTYKYNSYHLDYTYLSSTVQYFRGRHILYGIIAILCELMIGIGLPLVIITQRYLIRCFNLKLISIKPVIDQLQGCYKEEYRWFAAYYLICRQVIYATDIVTQFVSVNPSATVLVVCVLILATHLWLQPYKRKSLNFFDSIILFILFLSALSGFIGDGLCTGVVIICTVLPIVCLINYLALSSKLKHILIPTSCGCMLYATTFFVRDFVIFILLTLFSIVTLAYLIFALKCIVVKIWRRKAKYALIDVQHFDINEEDSEDDNS